MLLSASKASPPVNAPSPTTATPARSWPAAPGAPHPVDQAPGHLHEQSVAGRVTQGVVDRLEAVHVEQEYRKGLPGTRRCFERLGQLDAECPAIG
jgi:hypothetical protein